MRVCFLIFTAALLGCEWRPTVRSNEGVLQPKTDSVEETTPREKTVEFEGVSFRYDSRVFGGVKQEIVPEYRLQEPDFKPDRVAPAHIRFEFEFRNDERLASIEVYPLNEFPNVYSVNPDSVEYIKKNVEALRRLLKDTTYRLDGRIPHLPFEDVGHSFYERVLELDFQNGDGVIFITHWTHGEDLISNKNLLYRFEGLTADGKYYVTGETPISVAFLPDSEPQEFEGLTGEYLIKRYTDAKAAATYEKYIKSITTRLGKLGSNDFSPPLEKFSSVIASLKVTK